MTLPYKVRGIPALNDNFAAQSICRFPKIFINCRFPFSSEYATMPLRNESEVTQCKV